MENLIVQDDDHVEVVEFDSVVGVFEDVNGVS
jgi:hypothetical protein